MTVLPTALGFRLMCNRDEQHSRPAALPPSVRSVGSVAAICPTDPPSGGTWIAASEGGLVLALLNRRRCDVHVDGGRPTRRSRGEIIPRLLDAGGLADVHNRLTRLQMTDYEGFQLVAIQRHQRLVGTSDGRHLHVSMASIETPIMFTSSSLGDRDAERVRKPLFESLVCRGRDAFEGQRRFHDHRWPGCPSFSVRMARADARTVSQSIVTVHGTRVSFEYVVLSAA